MNVLPLKIVLRNIGVYVEEGCSLCRVEPESCVHVLRDCRFSLDIWTLFSFGKIILGPCPSNPTQWIKYIAWFLSDKEWDLFVFVAWEIWNQRNARLNGDRCKMPAEIVGFVHSYVEEFSVVHPRPLLHIPTSMQNRRRNLTWELPPPGSFRINCDAALDLQAGRAGVGIILRDHTGRVVEYAALSETPSYSVHMLETMAC